MKKSILIAFAVTIFCTLGFSQNVRFDGIALTRGGGPAPGAHVAICTQPAVTATQPCTPLANLCSSLTDLTCTSPNPITADGLGNYHFYILAGTAPYTVQLYGSGLTTSVLPDQTFGVGAGGNSLQVNATLLSGGTVVFSDITPVAESNALNIHFQTSGNSVSGELVGDGIATDCLNGTGAFSNCGGGTGAQFQSAYYSGTNLLGAFGPGLKGQVQCSQGSGLPPAYCSTGIAGSPRFPNGTMTVGTTDTIVCDNGVDTRDRNTTITYATGGAVTVTVPDASSTGCPSNFDFGIMVTTSTTVTVNRTTASTFTTLNGSTVSPGLTTFNLTTGQYATFTSDDNTNYKVRIVSGGGGVPTGVANGSQLVSSGVGLAPVYQTKLVLDARDQGVDCTGAVDSSTALNAITNNHGLLNGVTLTFPTGCNIKLANTWTIENASAFKITGVSGAGANGVVGIGVPTFQWSGAANGTVIDLEYVDGFILENFGVQGNGVAAVGINIDKTGTCVGCVNTTDGLLRRLYILGNDSGNIWTGISLSAVSGVNVEDIRITDSTIKCSSLTAGKGVAGITIGNSFNAKNEQFIHNNIQNCAIGVKQISGTMDLEYSELNGNTLDIQIQNWSDPNEHIDNNLSESQNTGQQFLQVTGGAPAHPITISNNNIPINTTCAVELSNSNVEMRNNTFYAGIGGGTGAILCNANGGGNGTNLLASNNNNLIQSDIAPLILAQTNPAAVDAVLKLSPTLARDNIIPTFIARTTGALFLEKMTGLKAGQNIDGLNFNASVQSSIPCAINTWCGMEGGFEVAGVVTPDGLFATATGGTGTTYGFYVSAVDAAGNETLLRGGGPFLTVSGPASLNGTTNFLTITGLGAPNASSCNIYAVNVANALQVNQIATGVSCSANWTFQVNSYPGTFPITTLKSPFNKTLSFLFRGKEADFQYNTPLNGFSDQGSTATWSLVSTGLNVVEKAAPSGIASSDLLYADSTAHRWKMNDNNGGAFNIPGVATAGTAGHFTQFAANGIDLVDSGGTTGTVTAIGGPLTLNAVVLGNGTTDTKVSTGINTNGASELDLGLVGTSGVLGLNGSTSGKSTFTPPAVAGTTTNAIVVTNGLQIPVGSPGSCGGGVSFTGATTTCLYGRTTPLVGVSINGTVDAIFNGSNQIAMGSGGIYTFTSGNAEQTIDTGISRGAAGEVDIGTGASTNKTGTLKAATLTASTAVNSAAYQTATNCSAVGTAANPSVASCTAAAAGAFSCDVAASAGTCTVNTTAVTANSEIFVQEVADEGTRLSVTCNTSPSVLPAITVASKVAGTSFTINMPTITTNPACFDYHVVN